MLGVRVAHVRRIFTLKMSVYCSHCGQKTISKKGSGDDNKDVHNSEEDDDSRWSCFMLFCSKKQNVKTKANDVAFNSEFSDTGAIYKRRTTTQFQPDANTDTLSHRRITYNKAQHSLSKFKVRIYMYVSFLATRAKCQFYLEHTTYNPKTKVYFLGKCLFFK